jgi:hypothetical protein
VELLVAGVVTTAVLTAMFQLLAAQARFVELQGAREEVQQTTRAALEIIGSELRAVPPGDALVRAAADSITFRTARVWGVVCALGGATSLDVSLPAIRGSSYAVNAGTGAVLNLGTVASPLWSQGVGVSGVSAATGSCNGDPLPPGVERRTFTLTAVPRNGSVTAVRGNLVHLYDQVTYRSGSSTGVPGLWIQRRLGDGTGSQNQPMAGPITAEGSGLRFRYFAGAGSPPLATPILDPALRASVTRVEVTVEASGRSRQGRTRTTKADTVLIPLRNRF